MALQHPKLSKKVLIENLRDIWKNEAKDFTPWLAKPENIAQLGEAIGVEIDDESIQTEYLSDLSTPTFMHRRWTTDVKSSSKTS